MVEFQLLETMRISPSGTIDLLDRHLNRLKKSTDYFGFRFDLVHAQKIIQGLSYSGSAAGCVRLTLSSDGTASIQVQPMPVGYVERLKLSGIRVDSKNPLLYHKTTNREIYDAARRECDSRTDAILMNELGEITETTIMNVAVFRENRWVTPSLTSGLLPGIMREELLSRGEIVEGRIYAKDLQDGELVRCFNALRGVFDVALSRTL